MHRRLILWVIFNVAAVALPVSALWVAFGPKTAIDPTSETQLIALGAAALGSFAMALIGTLFFRNVGAHNGPESIADLAARLVTH